MQTNDTAELVAPVLTPAQRKELRARAHHLNPVVMIGEAGLTEAVLAEARRAIEVHELVKVRVFGDDRALRQALMQQLCGALACAPVQMIGKLLVVYRPRPAEPAARPRGPHVPKKAAATGAKVAPARRRAPAAKAPPRAQDKADTGMRVWSGDAAARPGTRGDRPQRPTTRQGVAGKPAASRVGRPRASAKKR